MLSTVILFCGFCLQIDSSISFQPPRSQLVCHVHPYQISPFLESQDFFFLMLLTHWIWVPLCSHMVLNLGISYTWVAILLGLWLCWLGLHEQSCAVSRLLAYSLQYCYLTFCISFLCFFTIFQGIYLSFHMLFLDSNRLFSLQKLHIVSLKSQ